MLLTTSIGVAGGSEFFFFEITDSHALVTQGLNFLPLCIGSFPVDMRLEYMLLP